MAYHQTGQRPPGQYTHQQSSPYLHHQPPPPHANAEDEDFHARANANTAHYSRNHGIHNPSNYQDELHRQPGSAYPPRTTSYSNSSTTGTYQPFSQTVAPPQPPSYNPQQYGAPQPSSRVPYSPQTNSTHSATFTPGYQSYNPAAYHQPGQSTQPGFGAQPLTSQAPPPPPPRSYDYTYGHRVSPGSATNAASSNVPTNLPYRNQHSQGYGPSGTSANDIYTPPAPPPPPFSPGRDGFSSHTPSSATSQQRTSYSSPADDRRSYGGSPTSSHNRPLPPPQHHPSSSNPPLSSPSLHRRPVGGNSSLPQTPGTPGPTPPIHSPQRSETVGRHPHSRPLPGPPLTEEGYFDQELYQENYGDESGYDDLMQEVEAAVMGRPPPSSRRRSDTESRPLPNPPHEDTRSHQAYDQNRDSLQANGNIMQTGQADTPDSEAYDADSDAEAEAGLAAMRSADEQDAADEARRQSGAPSNNRSQSSRLSANRYDSPASSDSGVHVDMTSYGGGFSAPYHYGDQGNFNQYPNNTNSRDPSFASTRASQRSNMSMTTGAYDYRNQCLEYSQTFAPARVDTGGTGGLAEPGAHPRRLSFEDGDEATLADTATSYTSDTTSPSRDGLPEMFFYPSSAGGRPLPAAPMDQTVPQLMPAGTYKDPDKLVQYDEYGRPRFPLSPDAYAQSVTPSGTPVPRSSSLISHPSQPQQVQPMRSKTDADRARILKQQQAGLRSASSYSTDAFGDAAVNPSAELLDLPAIPTSKRRKFNPAKLSTADFKKCSEPWALSSIMDWLKDMTEGEADLKEHAVVDGIVALFTHMVPTMNTADAESLGAKVVRAMFDAGTLVKDEEWVKFGPDPMFGVLFQLTGTGCYSPRVHTEPLPGRCYSHHCMRTLKKINLQAQGLEPQRKTEDWATFYKIKKEDVANVDHKELELQNNLHEVVTSEDFYMDQINVVRGLYREELAKWNPPIISPPKREKFLKDVFGNIDAIKQANEEFLLPQLKYRQQEQGPWIVGFSDIFREWIRKAKVAYIDYAAGLPNAIYLINAESTRNLLFRQFLEHMQSHERSRRLDWQNFIKAPITRLQRYSLLLQTVYRHMKKDSEEKANLDAAIQEIKAVTSECDSKFDEMERRVTMTELATKLRLRPGMEQVKLNLTHLGREVLYRGDVQRLGSTKMSWLDAHAILFDHYFVLAKTVEEKHPAGGEKGERYDVSKLPIPMDLLVLESINDDPVSKSTYKGLGGVATKAGVQTEHRPGRQSIPNGVSSPGLNHVDTGASAASGHSKLASSTTLDTAREEKLLYPFRIRHLGRPESYALYTSSKTIRREWCNKIIEAKTRHAASLYKQNAEPFRLRVVADTAFGYDAMTSSGPGIIIRGTPLDRAVRELEKAFESSQRPNPVCRASVNCATAFTHPNGTKMLAVGTDFGVYLTESVNPRGWSRTIPATKVTQMAVLEEFSLFLLLTEKTLIAYHLDTVLHPSAPGAPTTATTRAPQKLSGARDIGFFAHGRMKERQLIFYKKREGVTSVFKVLEPIFQRSGSVTSAGSTSSMRSRLMSGMRGKSFHGTEAFRDFDDFYIGSDTYAINLFHSSLAISTVRGIEVMTLDKKTPISVPDLKAPEVASIAQRIREQRPLGMFRLSDSEFLLAYEEVGVYVNKHGDVSRSVIMDYIGRAKQACLVGSMYLILVDYNGLYVEVRNAINGRLRQVISGRDVKLLDDGISGGAVAPGGKGTGPGNVKIVMQHPEWERNQIVLELIVNEGLKE